MVSVIESAGQRFQMPLYPCLGSAVVRSFIRIEVEWIPGDCGYRSPLIWGEAGESLSVLITPWKGAQLLEDCCT